MSKTNDTEKRPNAAGSGAENAGRRASTLENRGGATTPRKINRAPQAAASGNNAAGSAAPRPPQTPQKKKKKPGAVYYGSIAVIIATVCFLVWYFYTRAHEKDVYEEMRAAASVAATPAPTPAPTAAPTPTPEPHPCPIDFTALQETSPNIYAWIEIPGMDTAYPVVQDPSNDTFYLKHDVEGNSNSHGAIYSEASVNAKDFSDYHTILYGHNMKDDSMFGRLNDYRDSDVLEANRDVYVYTPEEELHYRIFAAVTFSNGYIPYYYDNTIPAGRQAFLDDLPSKVRDITNHVLEDEPVTADDHLLILSTCTGRSDRLEHRYIVVAALRERTAWTS